MEPRVLYFTRSGNSERIARKIADLANCGVSRIADDKKWGGIIGFLRGGFYASNKKTTNAQITPEARLSDFSRVVIVGPVWAGNVCTPVYSLLVKEKEQLGKVCLVLTSGGGETEPAFSSLEASVGHIFHTFGIPKNKVDENEIASRAAQTLKE